MSEFNKKYLAFLLIPVIVIPVVGLMQIYMDLGINTNVHRLYLLRLDKDEGSSIYYDGPDPAWRCWKTWYAECYYSTDNSTWIMFANRTLPFNKTTFIGTITFENLTPNTRFWFKIDWYANDYDHNGYRRYHKYNGNAVWSLVVEAQNGSETLIVLPGHIPYQSEWIEWWECPSSGWEYYDGDTGLKIPADCQSWYNEYADSIFEKHLVSNTSWGWAGEWFKIDMSFGTPVDVYRHDGDSMIEYLIFENVTGCGFVLGSGVTPRGYTVYKTGTKESPGPLSYKWEAYYAVILFQVINS